MNNDIATVATTQPMPNSSPILSEIAAAPERVFPTLWTVIEASKFLRKSPRWVWSALTRRPEETGSIPHVRIGSSPRFFPEDLAAWVRAGCPPAATFAEWQNPENRRSNRLRSVHVQPSCPANKIGG